MKHVGLNVAADPLFTAAYTGVPGALVIVSADDPGMASSQNEQDNRRFAVAAGVPMLEPADSQEAYDFTLAALEISGRWKLPVLLRMTTRGLATPETHSSDKSTPGLNPVRSADDAPVSPFRARHSGPRDDPRPRPAGPSPPAAKNGRNRPLERNCPQPYDRRRRPRPGDHRLGRGRHARREAAPDGQHVETGPHLSAAAGKIARFVQSVNRASSLKRAIRTWSSSSARGYRGRGKAGNVPLRRAERRPGAPHPRRRHHARSVARAGQAAALCNGCPHRAVFEILRDLDCIVAGDIGCYSLGVLPPLEAMDSLVCMGASIGMGLGLRHVLPEPEARRVVSVIGDSTFVHSGITGLVEMVYNPPPTGHVVLILDNGTTAMTGLQEHPGTGRTLDHRPTGTGCLRGPGPALLASPTSTPSIRRPTARVFSVSCAAASPPAR